MDKILKNLKTAALSLRKARIEGKQDRTTEMTMNFIRMKEFLDKMETVTSLTSNGISSKAQFIIVKIIDNLKNIPSIYKGKVQDHNCRSIFYDFNNLYEYYKDTPAPPELDKELSDEVIALLRELIDRYTITPTTGYLRLKTLDAVAETPAILFSRDSKHFNYFSYYKDLKHLNKALELLNLGVNEIDVSTKDGKYQLLSIISQLGENLSLRMLSPRMVHFLSNDIDIEKLARVRNDILHREDDSSLHLDGIINAQESPFLMIQEELKEIQVAIESTIEHLKLAVRPHSIAGSISERAQSFLGSAAQITLDSIKEFYQKNPGNKYKYTKIPSSILKNCDTHEIFDSSYPALASKISMDEKNKILSAALLNNWELFYECIKSIQARVNNHFKENKLKGIKEVQQEFKLLLKTTKIQFSELENLNNPKVALLSDSEKNIFIIKQLKHYKNEVKALFNKIKSVTTDMTGEELYATKIDFNAYRVTDVPRYSIATAISDEYASLSKLSRAMVPQKYKPEINSYEMKFIYSEREHFLLREGIFPNCIAIGRTEDWELTFHVNGHEGYIYRANISAELYSKIMELHRNGYMNLQHNPMPEINLLPAEKELLFDCMGLQQILIPLTEAEHSAIYQENLAPHDVSFLRHRVLDSAAQGRLINIIRNNNMEDRVKKYLAFLEMSEDVTQNQKILLEIELLFIFIEQLNREVKTDQLSAVELEDLKAFRNYLAHDRELGDAASSHTHEQITLKYMLDVIRSLEDKIIPALESYTPDANVATVFYVNEVIYDDPSIIEIYQSIERSKKKSNKIEEDKELKAIEQIKNILGEDAFYQLSGLNKYILNALSNNHLSSYAKKVIHSMGDLSEALQRSLDLSYLYQQLDIQSSYINDHIIAIFEQLQYLVQHTDSSIHELVLIPIPHFQPDDEGGSSGGNSNPWRNGEFNHTEPAITGVFLVANSSFIYE